MTAVNCPMCELRFVTRTERDWHLRNEHRHHDRPQPHPPATAGSGKNGTTPPQPPKG